MSMSPGVVLGSRLNLVQHLLEKKKRAMLTTKRFCKNNNKAVVKINYKSLIAVKSSYKAKIISFSSL